MTTDYMMFVKDLLVLVSKHDVMDELIWDTDLTFYVNCNDVFFWGVADGEDVTKETLPILEQSLEDAGLDGMTLYCARIRGMRPQGAMYKHLDKQNWGLFDSCGDEREVDFLNPSER